MTEAIKKRVLGRPSGKSTDQVKDNLLDAARQLFLSFDYQGVSVRQIAELAGVNPAMVKYYFGDKKGLYLALVEQLFVPMEAKLGEMRGKAQPKIGDFIKNYTELLAENPWWPNFVAREVLFREGDMREAVLQKFKATMAPSLMHAVQQEISNGDFRKDLQPEFTLITLLSLSVFPFLAKPIIESVLDIEIDKATATRLAEHNTALFLHGAEAGEETREQS
jgi:AcrR family transcriptional regulator